VSVECPVWLPGILQRLGLWNYGSQGRKSAHLGLCCVLTLSTGQNGTVQSF